MVKLFIGNLSWTATEDALRELVSQFGEVVSVRIVTDQYTKRSKGFGFIEVNDEGTADEVIAKLNDSQFLGRPLRVSRARQEDRSSGGGGGFRGGDRDRERGGSRGGPRGGGRPYRPRFEDSTVDCC